MGFSFSPLVKSTYKRNKKCPVSVADKDFTTYICNADLS